MVITAESKLGSPKSMEYQANDKGQAEEICRNGLIGVEPKDWHFQMRGVERQNTRTEKYLRNRRSSCRPSAQVGRRPFIGIRMGQFNAKLDRPACAP